MVDSLTERAHRRSRRAQRSRDTARRRTTSRTRRLFPHRPRRRRPRTTPGGGCTPARGRPRPVRGTGSAGIRCGRDGRRRRRPRARARSPAWSSSASSAPRQLRARVRVPASVPQTRPVAAASSASAPIRSAMRREQPGEQGVGGRVEPEARCTGAEEIEVLGPPDGPAVDGLDVDQADLAQAFQVQTHGVGVDAESFRQLRRREGGGGAGELLVHRVAGLVAERLEHRQLMLRFTPVHALDGTRHRAYFQDVACINRYGHPHGDPHA